MYNTEKFNSRRPNVGVTVAVFKFSENSIKVKVYERANDAEEYAGFLSLPNCFYDILIHNNLEEAAIYALRTKTNIKIPFFEQLETFSGNYIDPNRINTVNVAYLAIINEEEEFEYQDDSYKTYWLDVEEVINSKELAFNHKEVLISAYKRLKFKAEYTPISCHLLGDTFTIKELRELTEQLIEEKLDNSRFRDRLKKSGMLIEVQGEFKKGANRPAQLYKLNSDYNGFFYPKSLTKPK